MNTYIFKTKKGDAVIVALSAVDEETAWDTLENLLQDPKPWNHWQMFKVIDPAQNILDNLFNNR